MYVLYMLEIIVYPQCVYLYKILRHLGTRLNKICHLLFLCCVYKCHDVYVSYVYIHIMIQIHDTHTNSGISLFTKNV